MKMNALPTHAVEAQLFQVEELEDRVEFAAWDPPGDWGGEAECTLRSDGTWECRGGVVIS